jgi:hypothetical protein
MTEDLRMTGNDYNVALLSFFVTYILFEVPSNLVSLMSSLDVESVVWTAADQHASADH